MSSTSALVFYKGNGGKRDSGVCMEDDEVVAMCTFGTSIGLK